MHYITLKGITLLDNLLPSMVLAITNSWMESQNWLIKKNQPVNTEYHGTDRYSTEILYLGERGTFSSGDKFPGGHKCVGPPRRHFTDTPTLFQSCARMEQQPKRPAKSAKKLLTLSPSPKHRAEQFMNNFCASGDLLLCKSCQPNNWKRADKS